MALDPSNAKKAGFEYEKKIARNIKNNPKVFHLYMQPTLAMWEGVGILEKGDGTEFPKQKDRAKLLSQLAKACTVKSNPLK